MIYWVKPSVFILVCKYRLSHSRPPDCLSRQWLQSMRQLDCLMGQDDNWACPLWVNVFCVCMRQLNLSVMRQKELSIIEQRLLSEGQLKTPIDCHDRDMLVPKCVNSWRTLSHQYAQSASRQIYEIYEHAGTLIQTHSAAAVGLLLVLDVTFQRYRFEQLTRK